MPENEENICGCENEEYSIKLNQQGPPGRKGDKGSNGITPSVTPLVNTTSTYMLMISDVDGNHTTDNMKGSSLLEGGKTQQVIGKTGIQNYAYQWQYFGDLLPKATPNWEGVVQYDDTSITMNNDGQLTVTSSINPKYELPLQKKNQEIKYEGMYYYYTYSSSYGGNALWVNYNKTDQVHNWSGNQITSGNSPIGPCMGNNIYYRYSGSGSNWANNATWTGDELDTIYMRCIPEYAYTAEGKLDLSKSFCPYKEIEIPSSGYNCVYQYMVPSVGYYSSTISQYGMAMVFGKLKDGLFSPHFGFAPLVGTASYNTLEGITITPMCFTFPDKKFIKNGENYGFKVKQVWDGPTGHYGLFDYDHLVYMNNSLSLYDKSQSNLINRFYIYLYNTYARIVVSNYEVYTYASSHQWENTFEQSSYYDGVNCVLYSLGLSSLGGDDPYYNMSDFSTNIYKLSSSSSIYYLTPRLAYYLNNYGWEYNTDLINDGLTLYTNRLELNYSNGLTTNNGQLITNIDNSTINFQNGQMYVDTDIVDLTQNINLDNYITQEEFSDKVVDTFQPIEEQLKEI